MDITLQEHDAKRVYPMPDGLKELSSDITREVLRCQPTNIYQFIADYVGAILLTREKAREAAIIVHHILMNDLTYEAMLARRGISLELANRAATVIQAAFRGYVVRKFIRDHKPPPVEFDIFRYLAMLGLDWDDAYRYAVKIQAAYRGFATRKLMKTVFDYSVGGSRGKGGSQFRAPLSEAFLEYLAKLGLDVEKATRAAMCIQRCFRKYRERLLARSRGVYESGDSRMDDGEDGQIAKSHDTLPPVEGRQVVIEEVKEIVPSEASDVPTTDGEASSPETSTIEPTTEETNPEAGDTSATQGNETDASDIPEDEE